MTLTLLISFSLQCHFLWPWGQRLHLVFWVALMSAQQPTCDHGVQKFGAIGGVCSVAGSFGSIFTEVLGENGMH